MHSLNTLAGADSVYAFMLGSPSFFTRADIARGFRGAVDMAIERLIELADRIDGDPDLEDEGHDEPSLGFNTISRGYPHDFGFVATDDREAEPEHDEEDGTSEPSLGFPERHVIAAFGWRENPVRTDDGDQRRDCRGDCGCVNEREICVTDEAHDADHEGNDEPSLARPEEFDQTRAAGGCGDLEDDNDSGLADRDAVYLELLERPGGEWGQGTGITDAQRVVIRETERKALTLVRSGLQATAMHLDGKFVLFGRSNWAARS